MKAQRATSHTHGPYRKVVDVTDDDGTCRELLECGHRGARLGGITQTLGVRRRCFRCHAETQQAAEDRQRQTERDEAAAALRARLTAMATKGESL